MREGGFGVDLAHVVAAVILPHAADEQRPGLVVLVRDAVAGDARDHARVNGHDHLPSQVNPSHLNRKKYVR